MARGTFEDRLLEQLFEATPDANLLVDQTGIILLANHQAEILFGYTRDEMVGQLIEMLMPEEFKLRHSHHLDHFNHAPRMRPMGEGLSLYARRKNGSTFPVDIMLSPFETVQGPVILCVVHDVTIQKANQQALKDQAALVRMLQEVSSAANQAASPQQVLIYTVNRILLYLDWQIGHALYASEISGRKLEHIWGNHLSEAFSEFKEESEKTDLDEEGGIIGTALKTGQPVWLTNPAERPNFPRAQTASRAGIRTALALPIFHDNEPAAVLEFFSTRLEEPKKEFLSALPNLITQISRVIERNRLQDELDEIQHRMIESIEVERVHTAQRLHDGPIQDLYGIFYLLQEVRGWVDPSRQAVFDNTLQAIEHVNSTLALITGELRPSVLAHLGLSQAMRAHIERIEENKADLTIHLNIQETGDLLDQASQLALFRIFTSLINNVVRHSKARHAWVRLMIETDEIALEVQDNGKGFELPRRWINLVRQGRYGLASIVERVKAMNGSVEFKTAPEKGTFVRVTVPLPHNSQQD